MWSHKLLRCFIISVLFIVSHCYPDDLTDDYKDEPEWVDDTKTLNDYEHTFDVVEDILLSQKFDLQKYLFQKAKINVDEVDWTKLLVDIEQKASLKDVKQKLEASGIDVAGLLGHALQAIPLNNVGKVLTKVITDTGNTVKGLTQNTGSVDILGLIEKITNENSNPALFLLGQILQTVGIKLDKYYKNQQIGLSIENIDFLKLLPDLLKKVGLGLRDELLKLDIDVEELLEYCQKLASHRFRRSAENVVGAFGDFLGGEKIEAVFDKLSGNFRALVEELQDARIVKRDLLQEYDDKNQ